MLHYIVFTCAVGRQWNIVLTSNVDMTMVGKELHITQHVY